MKNYIIPILLLIAGILLLYFGFKKSYVYEDTKTIDSLQTKIDSLINVKNQIDVKIDSIYIEIENNKVNHEKNINTILTNTSSQDLQFFTNYIQSNKSRLDSLYNYN